MQVFISGTGTNIGKTIISSWLAVQTGFAYFKPIQTGSLEGTDSMEVRKLTNAKVYPEIFCYKEPVSPHLAAKIEKDEIDIKKITLPEEKNLIIEGAGGLLVPINTEYLMIDLIKQFQAPVILVSSSGLGAINHTLLSLESLNSRNIKVLGVILNGPINNDNKEAIEFYGNTEVVAQFPQLDNIDTNILKDIPLPQKLRNMLAGKNDFI
jgi:dethiobiotin synthetase